MARNYGGEKRRRELEKKRKREEKRERRQGRPEDEPAEGAAGREATGTTETADPPGERDS